MVDKVVRMGYRCCVCGEEYWGDDAMDFAKNCEERCIEKSKILEKEFKKGTYYYDEIGNKLLRIDHINSKYVNLLFIKSSEFGMRSSSTYEELTYELMNELSEMRQVSEIEVYSVMNEMYLNVRDEFIEKAFRLKEYEGCWGERV